MSISTISVICYYNGNPLRTKTDVKYVGNKVSLCIWMYRLIARLNSLVI